MIPMTQEIPVVNQTAELKDCRDKWTFDAPYGCWCLEDVLYTQKADVPKFQRLSIFVPEAYLNADGTPNSQGRFGRYTGRRRPSCLKTTRPATCRCRIPGWAARAAMRSSTCATG